MQTLELRARAPTHTHTLPRFTAATTSIAQLCSHNVNYLHVIIYLHNLLTISMQLVRGVSRGFTGFQKPVRHNIPIHSNKTVKVYG